jgi:hypothetical protein
LARTNSRYIGFDVFHRRGSSAATVVKLMMACNDMSLANQTLADWKKEQPPRRRTRAFGARIYFLRMEFAHLYEGLKVIEQIRTDPVLMSIVANCDQRTQRSFDELLTYQKGGAKHAVLKDLAGKVRHNIAFHYDQAGTLMAVHAPPPPNTASATVPPTGICRSPNRASATCMSPAKSRVS